MLNRRKTIYLALLLTTAFELATIAARYFGTMSAQEYIDKYQPHILVQIHHMFWSLPLIIIGLLLYRYKTTFNIIMAISAAFIFSDLRHHFIILPLWVSYTG